MLELCLSHVHWIHFLVEFVELSDEESLLEPGGFERLENERIETDLDFAVLTEKFLACNFEVEKVVACGIGACGESVLVQRFFVCANRLNDVARVFRGNDSLDSVGDVLLADPVVNHRYFPTSHHALHRGSERR